MSVDEAGAWRFRPRGGVESRTPGTESGPIGELLSICDNNSPSRREMVAWRLLPEYPEQLANQRHLRDGHPSSPVFGNPGRQVFVNLGAQSPSGAGEISPRPAICRFAGSVAPQRFASTCSLVRQAMIAARCSFWKWGS